MVTKSRKRAGLPAMSLASATLMVALGYPALGQATSPGAAAEVYSQTDLLGLEQTLGAKTDASGLATQTLKQYATDYTLLSFRRHSGKAEQHEKFADFFYVIGGHATLVSGGHLVHGAATAPGEVRGDSIQDGREVKLKKGDIVHIPANLPHQLLLRKGATFQYFVVKVQEVN